MSAAFRIPPPGANHRRDPRECHIGFRARTKRPRTQGRRKRLERGSDPRSASRTAREPARTRASNPRCCRPRVRRSPKMCWAAVPVERTAETRAARTAPNRAARSPVPGRATQSWHRAPTRRTKDNRPRSTIFPARQKPCGGSEIAQPPVPVAKSNAELRGRLADVQRSNIRVASGRGPRARRGPRASRAAASDQC